jgi:hypothetical protein
LIDAWYGTYLFPLRFFGYFPMIEAVVTLIIAPAGTDTRVVLCKARGVACLLLGVLVVEESHIAHVIHPCCSARPFCSMVFFTWRLRWWCASSVGPPTLRTQDAGAKIGHAEGLCLACRTSPLGGSWSNDGPGPRMELIQANAGECWPTK